jgi:hypothetical protein
VNDTLMFVAGLLAEDQQPRDSGPDFGKASPFGLLVVVLLVVGTFALIWSMNRHLRKLPESFDQEQPEPDQAADDGTVGTGDDADTGGKPREPGG